MKFINFFRRGPSVNINLHPKNAKPYSYYKAINLDMSMGTKEMFRFGYTNDFLNTGEPGITVHGSKQGTMCFIDGVTHNIMADDYAALDHQSRIKKRFSPLEFYQYLKFRHSIDLSSDRSPLHLVCCYSGGTLDSDKSSVAQKLANIAQRPILAYGGYEQVSMLLKGRIGLPNIINGSGWVVNSENSIIQPEKILPNWRKDFT
ncbi:hypothetical protein ACSMDK_12765 [Yersinia enterocolitica]|uniref:hypothetical protein n=1 Tax=Yersinia TaxID=629 RepID=UPI003AB30EDE